MDQMGTSGMTPAGTDQAPGQGGAVGSTTSGTTATGSVPAPVSGATGPAGEKKPAVSGATGEEKAKAAPSKPAPANKSASRLSPEQQQEVDSWLRQAEQYDQQGEYGKAIYALEKALQIDRENTRAKQMLERVRKAQELRQGPT
jgi:hypothetical protein